MKRLTLLMLSMLLSATSITFGETLSSGGPAAFMDISFGARSRALGNAMTAMIGSEEAVFWNPASLATIQRQSISTGYISLSGASSLSQSIYCLPISSLFSEPSLEENQGGLAVFLERMELSHQIEARLTDSINPDYFFSDTQGVYGLVFSRPFNQHWGYGVTIKGLYHELDQESAYGWSVDSGVYWNFLEHATLGVAVKDIYSTIYWTTGHTERIQTRFSLGASYSYEIQKEIQLTATGALEKDTSEAPVNYALGIESSLFRCISLRASYNDTLAFGLGIKWQQIGWGDADLVMDYTLAEDKLVNWDHWISLKLIL